MGPKLSLAHGTLVSYELDFTVSQFFYTVAMCQHWHPAAQVLVLLCPLIFCCYSDIFRPFLARNGMSKISHVLSNVFYIFCDFTRVQTGHWCCIMRYCNHVANSCFNCINERPPAIAVNMTSKQCSMIRVCRECFELLSLHGDVQWGITAQEWMDFVHQQQQLFYKVLLFRYLEDCL